MIQAHTFTYNPKVVGVRCGDSQASAWLKKQGFHYVEGPIYKGWIKEFKSQGRAKRAEFAINNKPLQELLVCQLEKFSEGK